MTKALKALKKAKELLVSAHVATALIWERYDCVEAIGEAIAELEQPDCRLCAHSFFDHSQNHPGCAILYCHGVCTNGDKFTPAEPVRLYK